MFEELGFWPWWFGLRFVYFLFVSEHFACMYVNPTGAWCPWKSKRVSRPLKLGVECRHRVVPGKQSWVF